MKARASSCVASSCPANENLLIGHQLVINRKVQIHLNGELREFADGLTIDSLISALGLEPTRVAIEVNRNVVRRRDWQATVLHDEDRVEIVHFVGGGGTT